MTEFLLPDIQLDDKSPKQLSGLTLAYLGDAVYELFIRHYLITQRQIVKPNHLHHTATKYVSAKAQANIINYFIDQQRLTDEEFNIYKRGRNAHSHTHAKNTDVLTYRHSSGFEAVIGFLYLSNDKIRLKQWIDQSISYIEEQINHGTPKKTT